VEEGSVDVNLREAGVEVLAVVVDVERLRSGVVGGMDREVGNTSPLGRRGAQ
jgi:hypothetical protein